MDVHVGELIKKRVSELGLSVSEFARRLHCNRQNVYDIFARRSVDIELLQRISKILQHDFVAELYTQQETPKITLKFTITVEIDNGKYHVTDIQPVI